MEQDRVRIVDVADALGLSTATVSKVIHGKTEKISDETIKRVQQELERSGYIPNMAGILLAAGVFSTQILGLYTKDINKRLSDNDYANFDKRISMEPRAECRVCSIWSSWHIKSCGLYTYLSNSRTDCRCIEWIVSS